MGFLKKEKMEDGNRKQETLGIPRDGKTSTGR